MLAVVLQSESSHEMEFDGVYQIMGFHLLFCKLEVPKMWENSPVFFSLVLQFSVFCILIPTYEVGF
jgi:hypothetical protein